MNKPTRQEPCASELVSCVRGRLERDRGCVRRRKRGGNLNTLCAQRRGGLGAASSISIGVGGGLLKAWAAQWLTVTLTAPRARLENLKGSHRPRRCAQQTGMRLSSSCYAQLSRSHFWHLLRRVTRTLSLFGGGRPCASAAGSALRSARVTCPRPGQLPTQGTCNRNHDVTVGRLRQSPALMPVRSHIPKIGRQAPVNLRYSDH
jgi:hypothetical protein